MSRIWFKTALLPDGWADDVRFTMANGRIARIQTQVAAEPEDERYGIAVPGLPNVHSHTFQRALAGRAERRGVPPDGSASRDEDTFWTWREQMYRSLDRLDPDDIESIAAQAFVEMLEAGFTRVGEFHYLHNDQAGKPYANSAETAERIISAAHATGIGLTLLPVFYAHAGFGGLPPAAGQRRFTHTLDSFARMMESAARAGAGVEGFNLGIAPHSLRAVSPTELTQLLPLGVDRPVHIHVAEQLREVEDCLNWSGARPVQWLLDHAPVDRSWCLIHATHTTEAELTAVAARAAVVGLCPGTEANLGDGIFAAAVFLASGGQFGIGTDSNVLIDLAGELRQLEYAQRLTRRARNVLCSAARPSTGRNLFEMALVGGSQALGLPSVGFTEGQSADMVSLDPKHPSLASRIGDTLLDSWLFAARDSPVDTVWRAGRKWVVQGRHIAHETVCERFRAVLGKLALED
jgi:formimidoylglutamate deiminase